MKIIGGRRPSFPFHRQGSWGPQRLGKLPKVTSFRTPSQDLNAGFSDSKGKEGELISIAGQPNERSEMTCHQGPAESPSRVWLIAGRLLLGEHLLHLNALTQYLNLEIQEMFIEWTAAWTQGCFIKITKSQIFTKYLSLLKALKTWGSLYCTEQFIWEKAP